MNVTSVIRIKVEWLQMMTAGLQMVALSLNKLLYMVKAGQDIYLRVIDLFELGSSVTRIISRLR